MPRILDAHIESRHGKRGIVFSVLTISVNGSTDSQRSKAYILSKFPSSITSARVIDTRLREGSRGAVKEYVTRVFVPQDSISNNISLLRLLERIKSLVDDVKQ